MPVRVKFKGQGGTGVHQIGHRGGVTRFTNNEAIVPESVYSEWTDEGYPIEKVGEVDAGDGQITNYWAVHGPSQVAAMEKESLSKANVGDFHGLGTDEDVSLAEQLGNVAWNHFDTPVNFVNNNAALDRQVDPANVLAPNRVPLVEMTDDEKERSERIKAKARALRKRHGVPVDETNALSPTYETVGDKPEEQVIVKQELEADIASGDAKAPPKEKSANKSSGK